MSLHRAVGLCLGAAILLCNASVNLANAKPFMIVGIDEKVSWDDDGKPQKNGSLTILKIDGKKVTKTQDIEVGGLPEAVMFTPDGKYLLAGNYLTQDFSILRVNGAKVTDTGKRFKVPGHPASGRMSH
jgi:DNA-binding beta-propeller fold protein YncE